MRLLDDDQIKSCAGMNLSLMLLQYILQQQCRDAKNPLEKSELMRGELSRMATNLIAPTMQDDDVAIVRDTMNIVIHQMFDEISRTVAVD